MYVGGFYPRNVDNCAFGNIYIYIQPKYKLCFLKI